MTKEKIGHVMSTSQPVAIPIFYELNVYHKVYYRCATLKGKKWKFTQMILERLLTVSDINPKIKFSIAPALSKAGLYLKDFEIDLWQPPK